MATKKEIGLILLVLYCHYICAQEITASEENQLENHAAEVPDDDMQLLSGYTLHKISLNTADVTTLNSLGLLSPLQVTNFMRYRQLLGKLLSIYELQAIPGFDTAIIRRILPYVQVGEDLQPHYTLNDYRHGGENTLLYRYGHDLQQSKGFKEHKYLGSPDKLLLRYRYNFPRYMSWGFVTEKDPGEKLADFYSAHLFVKNYRQIKAFAVGDFTINMGQGLINWQAMALGKGPSVMQIKRENDLLRPYSSAGEFYFYRGTGITLQRRFWEGTAFISLRKLDGNISTDTLTSLYTSGYHRSVTELQKKNTVGQFTTGGNISFIKQDWHAGFNIIRHHFSAPLQKESAPYNLFAFAGRNLTNISMDYAATWKNMHFFGEMAMSGNYKTGIVHGVLLSVANNADISLLYRSYSRAYQSMYSNAFGEYYRPADERGLYMAVSLKLTHYLLLNAYTDIFSFPWLLYSMNAPGNGRDVLLALTYTPDKKTEAFIRYSYSGKLQKRSDSEEFIKWPVWVERRSWRCQLSMQPKEGLTIKSRVEVNSYNNTITKEQGFMLFLDVGYEFPELPFMFSGRYTKFVTGGTETTMYVTTPGMLYEYVLSQLYGNGYQYQLRIRWKLMQRMSLWARFQRVFYPGVSSIGSGLDEIAGNQKSVIYLQMQQLF